MFLGLPHSGCLISREQRSDCKQVCIGLVVSRCGMPLGYEVIEFLREGGRRSIVGTPKSMLKKFEQEILKEDWTSIRDGLEVKIVPWPRPEDGEDSAECDSSP